MPHRANPNAGEPLARTISVIVPTLNEVGEIAATLERLQPLRERGHEVIVVDGGSTDATVEQAAALADRVLVSSRGRARQMNRGAEAARGDVLIFLHADTRLPEASDRLILRALDGEGKAWGRFDVRLSGRGLHLWLTGILISVRTRITGTATGDQAIFVRRRWFEELGGFPDIPLMEDLALTHRLKRIGRPACVGQPVTTSSRRWEARGFVRTVLLMWRLRVAYYLGADPADLARQYR